MGAMSWYELLKSIHVLSAGLWFGSGIALAMIAQRALAAGPGPFGAVLRPANWWAGKAHPGAGVVLLLTGFAMLADADISVGETWVLLAIAGLLLLFGWGGAMVGRTSGELEARMDEAGGALPADQLRPAASRLLLVLRIETVLLLLVIVDMVVKPGA
jgi:uncharacterized membrane protein